MAYYNKAYLCIALVITALAALSCHVVILQLFQAPELTIPGNIMPVVGWLMKFGMAPGGKYNLYFLRKNPVIL
jgi:hypothetical protein